MFFRLSAHSPRDSGVRLMCCSSWQILHFVSVSVEPGPEMSLSACASPAGGIRVSSKKRKLGPRLRGGDFFAPSLSLNNDPHAMPAVPEIAERVPARNRGLRVALVVPGAREERGVARPLRLVLESKRAPGVRVQRLRGGELRALPGPALVGGDL